jgi:hypothetical protein
MSSELQVIRLARPRTCLEWLESVRVLREILQKILPGGPTGYTTLWFCRAILQHMSQCSCLANTRSQGEGVASVSVILSDVGAAHVTRQ